MSPRWTEQEIADLLQMYPNKSISLTGLEQHFGRRRGTIQQQARQLGLRRPHHDRQLGLRRPHHEWSKQDIADLIQTIS